MTFMSLLGYQLCGAVLCYCGFLFISLRSLDCLSSKHETQGLIFFIGIALSLLLGVALGSFYYENMIVDV
jgi:hypothetical protein